MMSSKNTVWFVERSPRRYGYFSTFSTEPEPVLPIIGLEADLENMTYFLN